MLEPLKQEGTVCSVLWHKFYLGITAFLWELYRIAKKHEQKIKPCPLISFIALSDSNQFPIIIIFEAKKNWCSNVSMNSWNGLDEGFWIVIHSFF